VRVTALAVVCLLVAAAAPTAPAAAGEAPDVPALVVFEDAAARDPAVVAAHGGVVTGGADVDLVPYLRARLSRGAVDAVAAHPAVDYVARDGRVRATAQAPSWGAERVNATPAAAAVAPSAQRAVSVAVLDSGVDHDHPDLNVTWGVDTTATVPTDGAAAADDGLGHGTHAAGIVAARDDDAGVVGVAPHARLYAVKVLGDDGQGRVSDVIEGIEASLDGPDGDRGTADDADVLSMSFGTPEENRALREAVESARDEAVLVAAAGNLGDGDPETDNVTYPGRYPGVIAVGATNRADGAPAFSSEGPAVDVGAPGVDIESTHPGGTYAVASGTSFAAPFVTGTVALLLASAPGLTPAEARLRVRGTAVDVGPRGVDNATGYGRLDAAAAVTDRVVATNLTPARTEIRGGQGAALSAVRADTGDPVRTTLVAGDRANATGADGTARLVFLERGRYRVTAEGVRTANATLAPATAVVVVGPHPFASGGYEPATLPRDPDGDGRYQDVNGDGTVDFDDAIALAFVDFAAVDGDPDQRGALDFDGDGDCDFEDAIELAFRV
jgi:subtilisin family serine protease